MPGKVPASAHGYAGDVGSNQQTATVNAILPCLVMLMQEASAPTHSTLMPESADASLRHANDKTEQYHAFRYCMHNIEVATQKALWSVQQG
jgi:hypothetical protein